MRITGRQLKQLIKEELKNLKEQDFTGGGAARPIISREEMQRINQCRSEIQAVLQRIT